MGVLSLSPWSHHLIIHPDNIVHIVPAAMGPGRTAEPGEAQGDSQPPPPQGGEGGPQYMRRGDTEVVREQPTSWEDAHYAMQHGPSQEAELRLSQPSHPPRPGPPRLSPGQSQRSSVAPPQQPLPRPATQQPPLSQPARGSSSQPLSPVPVQPQSSPWAAGSPAKSPRQSVEHAAASQAPPPSQPASQARVATGQLPTNEGPPQPQPPQLQPQPPPPEEPLPTAQPSCGSRCVPPPPPLPPRNMRLQSVLQPTFGRAGAVGLDQIPFALLGRAGAGAGAGAGSSAGAGAGAAQPSARSEASEQTQGGAAPTPAPSAPASGPVLAPAPVPAPVSAPLPLALSAPILAINAPLDGLQQMLADKAAERALNEQNRTRVAAEVDVMMDNGVRINPLCAQMYGEQRGEAATAEPSPSATAAQPVASAQSSAPGGTVDELEIDDDECGY